MASKEVLTNIMRNSVTKKGKKLSITVFSIVVLFMVMGVFSFLIFRNPLSEASSSFQTIRSVALRNPVTIHFLHTYHSLRKLPDIVFAPYYLAKSKLPLRSLSVTPESVSFLNSNLPSDPIGGYLESENRKWVNGVFLSDTYVGEVDVKYRGTNANHWNSFQKSFRVKFSGQNLFDGIKSLDFIIPYDRGYFVDPLNLYRARKLGIESLQIGFSRLKLNGVDQGVYLTVERWSNRLLQKRRGPDNLAIFDTNDGIISGTLEENPDGSSFTVKQREGSSIFTRHTGSEVDDYALEVLFRVLEDTDDETFQRVIPNIINLEKFYAFDIVSILSGSKHFDSNFGNTFLIFNPATGKFEISPWDLGVHPISPESADHKILLTQRILSVPEFRAERNKMLSSYIKDEDNLQDDLGFYDQLFQDTKVDFFTDNTKLYNNFQFLKQVQSFRDTLESNFRDAHVVLNYGDDYYRVASTSVAEQKAEEPRLENSFERFFETGYSINKFLSENPAFVRYDRETIALLPGVHFFTKDVIVPTGMRVLLHPDATIYLGEGVSFFSYSPVIAKGLPYLPIQISGMEAKKPWGTFAVINTESEESVLEYVMFDGGSGARINGITTTGMVAFHNADVSISHSTFKNSKDDDALNIKYGRGLVLDSLFENTFSDAIDLDFVALSTNIKGNVFKGIGPVTGGDGIDLSWSDVVVEENVIKGCSDKGVSVGESSKPILKNNTIENCNIGVAVKDSSSAQIIGNHIKGVHLGVVAYRKKDVFDGGTAHVEGNTIEETDIPFAADSHSSITGAGTVKPYEYIQE